MQNSKLLALLQSFSPMEMKQFRSMLLKQADGKELMPFFDKLYKLYPQFDERKTEKGKLFSQLYPLAKYNDQKMRHLIAELYGFAEKYLVMQETLDNDFKFSTTLFATVP